MAHREAPLACTVRACGLPLARGERSWSCERGHSFDIARSGYLSLLQPQDRRSLDAGDARATAQARRELLDAGFGSALREVVSKIAAAHVAAEGTVADLGCGEGHFLAAVCARTALDGVGIDLSPHTIELAARRHPGLTWIVANADRRLPLVDASLALVMSIDGRRSRDEMARVLAPGGTLLVAVPAEDDLAELRASVLGEAHAESRAARVLAELAPHFEFVEQHRARQTVTLDTAGLERLALATYRCARERERTALRALERLDVTTSHDVLVLRRV